MENPNPPEIVLDAPNAAPASAPYGLAALPEVAPPALPHSHAAPPHLPATLPAPSEAAPPLPWGVPRAEIVPLSARETVANAVARTARRALPDPSDGYVEMVASGLGVAPERVAARLWEGAG